MKTIMPLPVGDIVTLAELCAGRAVLMDGYDGASVVGAVADQAAAVMAHNPRRGDGDRDETRMIEYVRRALSDRDLHRTVFVGGHVGISVYDQYGTATFGCVVIDPDPADTDVPDRVRKAVRITDTVYVVDRLDQHDFQSLGLGASEFRLALDRVGSTLVRILVADRSYTDTEV